MDIIFNRKRCKNGFANLLPEEKTRDIYFEALSRSCADWLIGINTSRLYTVLLKRNGVKDVFSIGRVQTPTLALIVKREHEIANFKSEPFWEVETEFDFDGKLLKAKWHKDNISRVQEERQAIAIANFCLNKNVEIKSIKRETKEYAPHCYSTYLHYKLQQTRPINCHHKIRWIFCKNFI